MYAWLCVQCVLMMSQCDFECDDFDDDIYIYIYIYTSYDY